MHFDQQNEVKTMITGKTSLVGLLGNPVRHSLSPIMQNAAIAEMGLDWCYVAIPCETNHLTSIVKALKHTNCQGLNVTIPHKQNIIEACTKITSLSSQSGAVNTLLRNKNNNWTGTNTDIEGFLYPLSNENLEKKDAIIIGSGGSSRAVLTALKLLNLKNITIINRNTKNLNLFLESMKKNTENKNKLSTNIKGLHEKDLSIIEYIKNADLIINTTPVGMNSFSNKTIQEDEMPLGPEIWNHIKPAAIAYDLIYTPRPTQWLQKCHQQGSKTIDGLEMLIQQGAASLRLWSGINDVPVEIMRKTIHNYLYN